MQILQLKSIMNSIPYLFRTIGKEKSARNHFGQELRSLSLFRANFGMNEESDITWSLLDLDFIVLQPYRNPNQWGILL